MHIYAKTPIRCCTERDGTVITRLGGKQAILANRRSPAGRSTVCSKGHVAEPLFSTVRCLPNPLRIKALLSKTSVSDHLEELQYVVARRHAALVSSISLNHYGF